MIQYTLPPTTRFVFHHLIRSNIGNIPQSPSSNYRWQSMIGDLTDSLPLRHMRLHRCKEICNYRSRQLRPSKLIETSCYGYSTRVGCSGTEKYSQNSDRQNTRD